VKSEEWTGCQVFLGCTVTILHSTAFRMAKQDSYDTTGSQGPERSLRKSRKLIAGLARKYKSGT